LLHKDFRNGATRRSLPVPASFLWHLTSGNAQGLRGRQTVSPLPSTAASPLVSEGGEVTTYYCYEYSRVIKELDSEGSVAYNTYGTNLISRDLDSEKVYYLYNGHGDVTGLVDSGGTVITSYYYDSF